MFNNFNLKFQSHYKNESFEIRIKSRILLYFSATVILILSFLFLTNLATLHMIFSGPLLIILIIIVIVVISILLLYKGFYVQGVNIIIITFMIGLILFIILDTFFGHMAMFHINTLYYVFAIIVFAALFGSWKWLIALTVIYLIFGTSYYIFISGDSSLYGKSMTGVIIDYNFAILFVSSLSILIKRINESIVSRLETYYERLKHEMSERIILEKEMMTINETIQYKIGQDLHDDLGQHLVAIKMRSETLKQYHFAKSSADTTEIDAIIDLTNQAIRKTRRLLKGLGLIDLNADNFIKALKDLVLEIIDTYHISCEFNNDESITIYDDLMAINLYRIAQESIHNAINHGKAKKIKINLLPHNDCTNLEIIDDGSGFNGQTVTGKGMGLRIMKYRANIIGGSISISQNDAGGTTVICSFKI